MKIIFIIQGEGRGHQTQAIAMAELLIKNGHKVTKAMVGTSEFGKIPKLLYNNDLFEVESFVSPALAYHKENHSLSLWSTLLQALPNMGKYFRSVQYIKTTIEREKPDLIINFYDFLGGIFSGFFNQYHVPVICVGHQYLLLNKYFDYPQNPRFDRFLVNINSLITSWGADVKLALSFRNYWSDYKIHTVPPLLRSIIKNQSIKEKDFYLVYVTQVSLVKEVIHQCKMFPEKHFETFAEIPSEYEIPSNLIIHPISNSHFLERMAHCKGLISTAGFESVCEAMYLGKPVMMVPVKNHYEQKCNAFDAEVSGAGIWSETLDFGKFFEYLDNEKHQSNIHRNWFDMSEVRVISEIENVVKGKNTPIRKKEWVDKLQEY